MGLNLGIEASRFRATGSDTSLAIISANMRMAVLICDSPP